MTPDEQYAAAWLSEMWKPVREWHEPAVDKAVHDERNALLNRPVSEVRECA